MIWPSKVTMFSNHKYMVKLLQAKLCLKKTKTERFNKTCLWFNCLCGLISEMNLNLNSWIGSFTNLPSRNLRQVGFQRCWEQFYEQNPYWRIVLLIQVKQKPTLSKILWSCLWQKSLVTKDNPIFMQSGKINGGHTEYTNKPNFIHRAQI